MNHDIEDLYIDIGIRLHVKNWRPKGSNNVSKGSYLLVHGLSSNANTWGKVAENLVKLGYQVFAVDQRGHGLSDKPSLGYDFQTITRDLYLLVNRLDLNQPIMVGQSWGGNVLLEFGARYPEVSSQFVFVDGGFINLSARGTWESISSDLKPPNLSGLQRDQLKKYIQEAHPLWDEWALEATLGNFQTLPDGTIQRWLNIPNHMSILKAMYDQNVSLLFSKFWGKVLICAAENGTAKDVRKQSQVETALSSLVGAQVVWFENTAHDIHVDRPLELTKTILDFTNEN